MKREFVQLAQKYDSKKYTIGGWYFSEKLDGERCYWDGGITRGLPKSTVPWANTTKDARYIGEQISTGLWSRYGHVIHAPAWWLNTLPTIPLDGELYSELLQRQDIHSAIKKITPIDREWEMITYMVFDSPSYITLFADGVINNTNFNKLFKNIMPWIDDRFKTISIQYISSPKAAFRSIYSKLNMLLPKESKAHLHQQWQLPYSQHRAIEKVEWELSLIDQAGGEGLILRNPDLPYACERTHHMLKVKTWDDAEGTVIGCITGRETDKGSKLLGMMGALILRLDDGQEMELSGFTDEERVLCERAGIQSELYAQDWAIKNPETKVPDTIEAKHFPRGLRVTFKYRGLNNSGIPNEARYWRKDERI